MITVSLPDDTPLGLIGGVEEREFGLWVPVEGRRWYWEDGRFVARYTLEEAELVVGMLAQGDGDNGVDRWWLEE